jgi:hypothetical protein
VEQARIAIARHAAGTLLLLGAALSAHAQEAKAFSVPFTIHGERAAIIVDAVAAGRRLRLVVDTGSKLTILHHLSVGLSNVELVRARTTGAATRGTALAVTTTVELGPQSRERTVAAMDLSDVQKLFGERVDGVIGMDVLMDCGAVVLDFVSHTLRCGK